MNLGFQVVKVIKTDEPLTEQVYNMEKMELVERPIPGKFRELSVRNTDKIVSKAPNMGHFKVFEDEKVAVYQRNKAMDRVFVIKQWKKNQPSPTQTSSPAESQVQKTTE